MATSVNSKCGRLGSSYFDGIIDGHAFTTLWKSLTILCYEPVRNSFECDANVGLLAKKSECGDEYHEGQCWNDILVYL